MAQGSVFVRFFGTHDYGFCTEAAGARSPASGAPARGSDMCHVRPAGAPPTGPPARARRVSRGCRRRSACACRVGRGRRQGVCEEGAEDGA
eukprot:1795322-Prymnesium_polylepis.2